MTRVKSSLCRGTGLSILILLLAAQKPEAQERTFIGQPSLPLERILNQDGSLNLKNGFQGSLNAAGWTMITGPSGDPRFARADSAQFQPTAVPEDVHWDDRFAEPGLRSSITGVASVFAVAVSGSDVYIGGQFETAGGIPANNIAKWDGANWSTLGSGAEGAVFALAVSGGDLYAGGLFTVAGGITANRIARWNGTSWSSLGTGVSGSLAQVRALAVSGTDVYVGGTFVNAGGVSVNHIAKWDGISWSALGTGVAGFSPSVNALLVNGSNLHVGGKFSTAGGVTVNNIAIWNGSSWSALGNGVNGPDAQIHALGVTGTDLYVGGRFNSASGVSVHGIARWNGSNWSDVGGGVTGGVLGEVRALAVSGTSIYAGGDFQNAGVTIVNHIAKWDGSSWSALNGGVSNVSITRVDAVAIGGGNVFAGGSFVNADGLVANSIASWDGTEWSVLGLGLSFNASSSPVVNAIAVSGNNVYVGGVFTSAGGVPAKNIAKWDGANWSALGSGVSGPNNTQGEIRAIAVSGANVYVGGQFATAGGVTGNSIAKWDGVSWSALGSGITDGGSVQFVGAIGISGSDVYVGGFFSTAGGVAVNNMARWNGAGWSDVGGGLTGGTPSVFAIAVSGGDVYVGGTFNTAGAVSANNIAKWNGSSWTALGSGLSRVNAIAVSGSDVYAGGDQTFIGPTLHIVAKWNGSTWSALDGGVGGAISGIVPTLRGIAVSGSDVYVGGRFTTAGGLPASHVAKWDGASWSPLGSGLSGGTNFGMVHAVAADGNDVYVGGHFIRAGDKPSSRFAFWSAFSISPSSDFFPSGGGAGSVDVFAPFGFVWPVSANVPWIDITSGPAGSGAGTVTYSVDPNLGSARTGIITIGDRSFTVTQAGDCSFSISPTSESFGFSGGTGTVGVIAPAGCSWSVTGVPTWITITAGSSGAGNGTVSYSVQANPGSARNVTLTIAGLSFTVNQAAFGSGCTFSLSPPSESFTASGGSASVNVTTQGGCDWSASSPDNWITITSGSSGTGIGTVSYTVAANAGAARTGTIAIGDQTFTVNQGAAGGVCSFSILPTSQSFTGSGGTGIVTVTTEVGCAWTASTTESWITINAGSSGTGGGSVNYTVAPHVGPPRSGIITIAGLTFTVNQAEGFCIGTLSPTTANFPQAGGTGSVDVATPIACNWTATPSVPWLLVQSGHSGTGSGVVPYFVASNNTTEQRVGTLLIAGQEFTVIQEGVTPLAILTPSLPFGVRDKPYSQQIVAAGGQLPYSWSVVLGTLPPGLTLNPASGLLSGTPTVAGDFTFTVKVTDFGSRSAQKEFSVTVFAPTLSMVPTVLPGAVRGLQYSRQLSANGGHPPYNWAITGGTLPSGLGIDPNTGTISGVATISGTFLFTVTVSDQKSASASNLLRLVVIEPGEAPQITNLKYKNHSKLIVIGRNFDVNSRVIIDGQSLVPIFGDGSRLVLKRLVLSSGVHEIRVLGGNGILSEAASLTVQ